MGLSISLLLFVNILNFVFSLPIFSMEIEELETQVMATLCATAFDSYHNVPFKIVAYAMVNGLIHRQKQGHCHQQ